MCLRLRSRISDHLGEQQNPSGTNMMRYREEEGAVALEGAGGE